jgi:Zn-dependent protease with chaperone function
VLGAGGGLLASKYTFLVNSREDEMEADRIGFKYSVPPATTKTKWGNSTKDCCNGKSGGGGDSGVMKSLSDALSTHPPMRRKGAADEGDGREKPR